MKKHNLHHIPIQTRNQHMLTIELQHELGN